jgi:hypothetical protein
MNYVIFTHEPRGIISRTICRSIDLFDALEEARRKSQVAYVEKAVMRQVFRDGSMSPLIAEFVKGRPCQELDLLEHKKE